MKYKTINQKRYLPGGLCLSRIVAKRDFGNIKKGTLGGFIEDTRNLSQSGDCWVGEKAAVYGLAHVSQDAVVRGHAVVSDHAIVTDNAVVEGRVLLDEHVFVGGHAYIGNSTYLSGTCTVIGNARLYCYGFRSQSGKTLMPNVTGLARIKDFAFLEGRVSIRDHATIAGQCKIIGRVRVIDHALICDEAEIRGNALIAERAHVIDQACICDRAVIAGNALIGRQTILGGKSFVNCNGIVMVNGRLDDIIVSGDQRAVGSRLPSAPDGSLRVAPLIFMERRTNATA